MQKFITIFQILLLAFVVSCSQKSAPVVDRGNNTYGRGYSKNKYKSTVNLTANAPKASEKVTVATPSSSSTKAVTVQASDTIYNISRKNNVPLRDLVEYNNLTPPYTLKVGDKIKIPQNKYHQVASGDTLFSISRQYNMNVNNLIALNELKEPYSVKLGQMLKVSGASQKNNQSIAYKKAVEESKPVEKPAEKIVQTKLEDPIPEATKTTSSNARFSWPVKGIVVSKFGPKAGGLYNDGINIKANAGSTVKATDDGIVAYVGDELRGYGNLIILKHSGGWISAYAHLDKTKVTRGARVVKGQSIATVGSTGNVKSPQLYFGLRKGREAVNPQLYL